MVDPDDWASLEFRKATLREVRKRARAECLCIRITLSDGLKTVRATIDGRFWIPLEPWQRANYRTSPPR